jgi:L-malate glycosyltransferase
MKIAFLAPANSVHTTRWVNGLARRGLEVHLISAHDAPAGVLDPGVRVHRLDRSAPSAYLLSSRRLAAILQRMQPDLLNAHYASGYGSLARLSGFKPMLLSVWGSDVYDFPAISPLHRWLIRGNLQAATAVASTSECMARKTAEVFRHPQVFVTPFGVDETVFVPGQHVSQPGRIVVGTVKTLARKYGIDVLIDAFALALRRLEPATRLFLEITGSGPEEQALRRQADRLGIADRVSFHAAVAHDRVPAMLHRLDIFAALSRDDSESFGVAAVEAAACAKSVLVSDVDGFVEVARHEETGLIVRRNDAAAAADALVRLAGDAALRASFGRAGRERVLRHYTWERSLDRMIAAYRAVAAGVEPGAVTTA